MDELVASAQLVHICISWPLTSFYGSAKFTYTKGSKQC